MLSTGKPWAIRSSGWRSPGTRRRGVAVVARGKSRGVVTVGGSNRMTFHRKTRKEHHRKTIGKW